MKEMKSTTAIKDAYRKMTNEEAIAAINAKGRTFVKLFVVTALGMAAAQYALSKLEQDSEDED